jgi:hypothetical protein
MELFKIFSTILNFLISLIMIKTLNTHNPKTINEFSSQQQATSSSSTTFSIYDISNIPENIINSSNGSVDEILNILATRKYRACKANVLYHPTKKLFYFRNPSIQKSGSGSGSMKEYIPIKCKNFTMRGVGQRFYLNFKDIEQILENNEDSILLEGIHEITDLRKGLEMSLFPVKFFKSLPESNYSYQKDLLCFDSIKVLGIDKNNNDYYILSALDKHRIIFCDGYDINKKYNLNNFIRYSSYCDEFCAEDFIYFSNDLSKCKCNFFTDVDDLKKNKNYITSGANSNETEVLSGCFYSRKLDRYEIFANPYELTEKLNKYEEQHKSHYRYYFNLFTIFFTFQILYVFYFTEKNNVFMKFTIIFYVIIVGSVYVSYRIKKTNFLTFEVIIKLCEIISDIYPILLLIFVSCNYSNSNSNLNSNYAHDINFTKQIYIPNPDYDVLKLAFIILTNSFDQILKEIKVNELELVFRLFLIISSFIFKMTGSGAGVLEFFAVQVRIKNIFELICRFSLYLVEWNILTDFSVPLFIILGRSRDSYINSDHVLFQANYLKLKPNFDKLYENWFMEALNFHKFKNMILFLKFVRYYFVIHLLSLFHLFNSNDGMKGMVSYLTEFKFERIFIWFLNLSYKNLTHVCYSYSGNKNSSNSNLNSNLAQGYNIIDILHFPILFAFLYTNVILTKDCLKIFLIHFFIGLIMTLLSEEGQNPRKKKFNSNQNLIDLINDLNEHQNNNVNNVNVNGL